MSKLGLTLTVLLAIVGCWPGDGEAPTRSDCGMWWGSFFREFSISERMAKFHDYSVDQQYAIYICGNRRHPPALELAEPFAKEGEPVVGFLTEKLSTTKNDSTVRQIISIFNEMQYLKTYDVASNAGLMSIMADRAAGIKDEPWRGYTQKMVAEIQTLGANSPLSVQAKGRD